jgi:subtilase family serine protease
MRPSFRLAALITTLLAAAVVLSVSQAANAAPSPTGATHRASRVCAAASAGEASCNALVRTDIAPAATPSGYGPADLRSAYKLTTSGSSSQTIGIVDAYDAPTAESDLAAYRTQFGLSTCSTANGCFRKVDQNGGTNYPHRNTGWAQEISLDLDMASAICPNCHILLVEAKTNSFANLGAAENRAVTMGANVVSNSWGGSDASDATYGSFFNHPGVAITVSSGDAGYGVEYPASSHYVTAVGGTHLVASGGTRGWTETAWSGAGSGCSTFNTALSGAAGAGTGCALRAEADVSAVADPNTGVAVRYNGKWLIFGGTSVASPIIAGVYALAGNEASIDNNYPYTHSGSLFDVTSGSNGTCPTTQWCNARAGWDGPTGLGTPNGTGAF